MASGTIPTQVVISTEQSLSVGANNFVQTSFSVSKSQYGRYPVGIVGWSMSGSTWTYCIPVRLYIEGETCYVVLRNVSSAAASPTLKVYVLYN